MLAGSVTFPVPQIDDLDSLCVRRRRTAEPHCEAVRSDLDQTGGETSQLAPVLNTLLPPVIHTVELHTAAISDRVHHYSDSLPEQTVLWRVFKSDFLVTFLLSGKYTIVSHLEDFSNTGCGSTLPSGNLQELPSPSFSQTATELPISQSALWI